MLEGTCAWRELIPFQNHKILFVIPAKAGIQRALLREDASWIPAFAGMTISGVGSSRFERELE